MRCLLLAALLSLMAAGAGAQTAAPAASPSAAKDNPVVARRGDAVVTGNDVRDMLAAADPDQRRALLADPQSLRRLVRDRLLAMAVLDAAHAKRWDTRPEVIYRGDRARESAVSEGYIASITQPDPSYPSDAELQAAYGANKARFMLPRQYHLAQIFTAAASGATPAMDAAARRHLVDVRNQVVRQTADFAAIARRSSDDKVSGPNGGDLGWVREDQVIPALRSVVSGLAEGAVSDPIRVTDGWHLVRVVATRPAAPATLAEVRAALVKSLRQDRQQQNARAYLQSLLTTQPIELNEITLAAVAK